MAICFNSNPYSSKYAYYGKPYNICKLIFIIAFVAPYSTMCAELGLPWVIHV